VRAIYRREARRDITLPARLPTSAVEFNAERASQKGLAHLIRQSDGFELLDGVLD
jgi:hypothetical protein